MFKRQGLKVLGAEHKIEVAPLKSVSVYATAVSPDLNGYRAGRENLDETFPVFSAKKYGFAVEWPLR